MSEGALQPGEEAAVRVRPGSGQVKLLHGPELRRRLQCGIRHQLGQDQTWCLNETLQSFTGSVESARWKVLSA